MNRSWLVVAAALVAGQGESLADQSSMPGEARAGLPFSAGRTFYSLDEYLAYLEERSAADVPYYRRLPDGRFERMTGRAQRGRQGEIFTREELLQKFGFSR